jgi:hypothetical protein
MIDTRPVLLNAKRIPGYNVDPINVTAGLRELVACGYPATELERHYVIQYALMRWARGEEEAAQRGAIDQSFHGIPLTCWIRVLAAARAAAPSAPKGWMEG